MQKYIIFLFVFLAFLYTAAIFAWSVYHESWRMLVSGSAMLSLAFLVYELSSQLHQPIQHKK